MESKIINFLTVKIMTEKNLRNEGNPHSRTKTAWIEAKRAYSKLTEEEKELILKEIKKKNGTDGGN